MVKRGKDDLTLDLFNDYEPPEVVVQFPEDVVKGSSIDVRICRAISEAMKRSDKSRAEIADEMTDFLGGQTITTNMLDVYASPARQDQKITLERAIALAAVCDSPEFFGFICSFSNLIAVPEKYKDVIDLWHAEEYEAKLSNHLTGLRHRVKGMTR